MTQTVGIIYITLFIFSITLRRVCLTSVLLTPHPQSPVPSTAAHMTDKTGRQESECLSSPSAYKKSLLEQVIKTVICTTGNVSCAAVQTVINKSLDIYLFCHDSAHNEYWRIKRYWVTVCKQLSIYI